MATNIVLKRSATQGAEPGTSDLELGEIALNTYDGKMYMKKTVSGSSSIVELTGSVAPSSSAFAYESFKFVASGSTTTFTGSDADSKTLAYTAGQIQVYLNGVLLDAADYTASNGSSVVLGSAASSGDILMVLNFSGTNPFDYFKYTATNAQTSFSGNDANSNSLLYTVGNISVHLNGVLLDATDYTATTGTSVVLASGATTGDILVIHEFNETALTDVSADTTPQLSGDLDVNGNDIVSTSNANIDIIPHGTGNVNLGTDTVAIGTSGENVTVTTSGTGDMTMNTNGGTNSGSIVIADGANNNITITPNGSGKISLDGLLWPNADGSANQFIQTDGSGNLSFVDVLDTAEEIADTVGAMVSSNTETGITVTYQDGDNTLDFALDAAQTTITSLLATDIKIGEDDQTKIDFETADEIHFYAANAHQVKLIDGAIVPATDNDIDLGTSSLEFKDAYFDGTVTSDAFAGPLTGDVTGNVSGSAATVTTAAQTNITSLGTLTALTVDNMAFDANTLTSTGTFIIDSDTDITLDADGGDLRFKDGGTTISTITNSSNSLQIKVDQQDADFIIKGDDGGSEVTPFFIDMSTGGRVGINQTSPSADLHITGSGDTKLILEDGSDEQFITAHSGGLNYGVVSGDAHTFVVAGADAAVIDSGSARVKQTAITSSSNSIAWDAKAASNAYHVTTENTTFAAPSNAVEGAVISVELAQGGTARTIAWNTVFEFAASTAPTVTATANKTDIFTFRYNGSVWQEIGRVQNMAQT